MLCLSTVAPFLRPYPVEAQRSARQEGGPRRRAMRPLRGLALMLSFETRHDLQTQRWSRVGYPQLALSKLCRLYCLSLNV